MPSTTKLACIATALMAVTALAKPHRHSYLHRRSSPCKNDFGLTNPPGYRDVDEYQWCMMINNEVLTLETCEVPSIRLPNLQAQFTQANIRAPPASAIGNVQQIMNDSLARGAMQKMLDLSPTGSPDLATRDVILEVYGPAIKAACKKTGVPEDMLADIIITESKGHPLVYQSLVQIGDVEWGQMVDANPDLKNKYLPADNIMAGAMFLARAKKQYGGSWEECYRNHYQDPNAASYAA